MKCLVIPDVHLKMGLIDRIDELWRQDVADQIICLGDLLDDWNATFDDYVRFKDRFSIFTKLHRDHLLLLWGNHDYGYMFKPFSHSGFDERHWLEHRAWLKELNQLCPIQTACVIGSVSFSHASITKKVAKEYHSQLGAKKTDLDFYPWLNNQAGNNMFLWCKDGPLWHRAHNNYHKNTYNPNILQVVGHTPVMEVKHTKDDNILYTDTWSTWSDGTPLGNKGLVVVDTEAQTWEVLK